MCRCPPAYHVTNTSIPPLLSRTTLEHDPDFEPNFPRSAKWCADGSALIVHCENRSFQMFETASPMSSPVHLTTFSQPAPIVDFVWYPGASRHNAPAFCFVASVRDCPIKLLDGCDGRLRASYPIVDHRERHVAPHSLAFNLTADKLYCGFEDAIEIFDVQRPGEGERLPTTPSKKSKDGLKGIISALAFSYSPEYYAAGSLIPASNVSDNIALFHESALEPVLSMGGVAEWEKGGVTQLMFNPTQPHMLYAAFRRSERLWNWDLRGDTTRPLRCFSTAPVPNISAHSHLTNQKSRFDIDSTGTWLASGNQLGGIMVYDLQGCRDEPPTGEGTVPDAVRPTLLYDAHGDSVGAVTLHPIEPLLLSVSGSRHFNGVGSVSDSEESDSGSESDDELVISKPRERPQPSVRDASIKLWDFRSPSDSNVEQVSGRDDCTDDLGH